MRGFQGDLGGMAAEVRHPRARVGSRRPPARKGVGIARCFQGLRAETRGGAFIRTGIETCRSTRACPRPRRAAGGLSSEQELRRDPEHVVGSCHVEPAGGLSSEQELRQHEELAHRGGVAAPRGGSFIRTGIETEVRHRDMEPNLAAPAGGLSSEQELRRSTRATDRHNLTTNPRGVFHQNRN